MYGKQPVLGSFHSGHEEVIQTLSISCLLMPLPLWPPSHPLAYHKLNLACPFIFGADALFRFNVEEWLWCTHIFTYFYNHTACNELNTKYNCHIYIFQQTIHHNYVASCQWQSRIICPNSSYQIKRWGANPFNSSNKWTNYQAHATIRRDKNIWRCHLKLSGKGLFT